MKSFKSLALVFAAAILSFGSFAQASNTAKPAAKSDAKTSTAKPAAKPAAKADAKKGAAKSDAKKTDAAKK